jgi:hypothetical protein
VEPFPIGSGLGIIEACQYGAIPLFSKHPASLCSTFEVFHTAVQALFDKEVVRMPLIDQLNWYLFAGHIDCNILSGDIKKNINRFHRGAEWSQSMLNNVINDAPHSGEADLEWIKREASFFQDYQMKNEPDFLLNILSLKNLVDRKGILFMFVKKLFPLSVINKKSKGKLFHRLIYG